MAHIVAVGLFQLHCEAEGLIVAVLPRVNRKVQVDARMAAIPDWCAANSLFGGFDNFVVNEIPRVELVCVSY